MHITVCYHIPGSMDYSPLTGGPYGEHMVPLWTEGSGRGAEGGLKGPNEVPKWGHLEDLEMI